MCPTCCAVLGRSLRHNRRSRLRGGHACARLGAAPCQIAQNTRRSLYRSQRLRVCAQAAVNPLGHKQQGIVVQSLPTALTDGRHKGALQGGAIFQ